MKGKYSRIVITFVLDGRNTIIRESKNEDASELLGAIRNCYLTIGKYRYQTTNIQMATPTKEVS